MRLSTAAAIAPSRIRALAALAEAHPGTLRLFYGEDTLPTPDFIKQAAHDAIQADRTYYTPNAGYPELRREIAEQYGRLHDVPVEPDEVVVTASGTMAIHLAIEAVVGPGDSAIVVGPLWPNFIGAIRVTGAEAIDVPLALDEHAFRLDLDRLEAAIQPNTRMLALASPGNPTGWMASKDDWQTLIAFCERHGLWLLADGVYERIVFGETSIAPSPLSIPNARERTIILQSCSKAYRMTGWRVGYAICPKPVAKTLAFLQEYAVSHAFGVAQEAARVALRDGEDFIAEARTRYALHREIAVARLRQIPGIQVPAPDGAFYVFPKFDGLTDSVAFCEFLVREHRVGVAPGSAFGEGGEGHIRICFAVDEQTLCDGLDRIAIGWETFRDRSERS